MIVIAVFYIFFLLFVGIAERKNFRNLLIWELIVIVFFIFGFLAYIIFGNRLKIKAKKQLLLKQKTTKNYLKLTSWYKKYKKNNQNKLNNIQKQIYNVVNKFNCDLWNNNQVTFYTSGTQFLNSLIEDLKKAKHSINLQFYIFADDISGNVIKDVLIEKAKQGVVVNLIYDGIGSFKTSKKFWEELKQSGVNVFSFFPSMFKLWLINFKINYRNHRKIVVIDGIISYTGGINIRDDHMGKHKKLTPWHDTQLRICGNASYALQDIFLNDLCFCSNINLSKSQIELYFPKPITKIGQQIQIIPSGPDKNQNQIEECYKSIIKKAVNFIYIQTPYFVINNHMLNLIIEANKRGVDIRIYIPKIPDKKFVYAGTVICIKQLIKNNIKVYLFNGFIHSKVLITENILSVGTCNFDNRSLHLNFEDTCFLYNKSTILSHKKCIEEEMKESKLITKNIYKRLARHNIINKILYKLLYKIL